MADVVLRDKGGDEAQGYLFSQPVPADRFRSFVDACGFVRALAETA